jgi:hypothetical protein
VFSPTLKPKRLFGPVTLGCMALCGAVLALAVASAPSPAAATAPKCKASNVVVWLDTQADAGAGSARYQLEFTNIGKQACTLKGYPGAAAVNLAGKQLGSAAMREPGSTRAVKVQPERSATAILRITEAGNYPENTCGLTTAAGVRVSLPGVSGARVIPFPFSACAKTGAKYLGIGPIKSGS